MTLAPIQRARLALRQAWDVWTGNGTGASSTAQIAWDSARYGNRLKNWFAPSTDFVSFLNPATVKNRARDAYRNNALARRAIDLLVNYTVGVGLKPQVDLTDAALRKRVGQLWNQWSDECDFNGRDNFAALQNLAFRTALVDGEVLCLVRPGPDLKIQLLSSEHLATMKDNGVDIGGGIQYSEDGRRLGFWLLDKIPPRALNPVPYFIPVDRVVHLFAPLQPGYERGISALGAALVPLYELQGFLESSLVRMRTSSLFCGFVRSADGSPILQNDQGATEFEPGSVTRLRVGDEISFSNPPDASQSYSGFVSTQIRSISSAMNVPYELLANDVSAVTFASGRASLLCFERVCDGLVQNLMAPIFCAPIWRWWCKIQVASGALPEEILTAPVRWVAPEFQTLDARMTTNATVQKIRAGLMSRAEAVASNGGDVEALDLQIQQDNLRADRLQLIFDSDPRRVNLQGMQQPDQQEANNGNATIQ
jgi:lambda family phage portal protein